MKTSFDFERYRKNLSDELRQERKAGHYKEAEEKLAKEKTSERYQISKELKLLSKKYENFEVEKKLEINEYDISESIPEKVKLFIDKNRILALKGEEMGSSVFKNKTERIEIEEASKKFIDRLVNGAYGDENKLNTTIYGYSGKSMLAQQIVEGTLELPPNAWNMHEEFCQEVFFSAGYNPFYEPHKVLVIADPSKERFLKSIKRADGTSDDDMEMLRRKIKTGQELPSDFLEPTLRIAREGFYGSKLEGARIIFKGGIRWIDIADYIVDLPNGKLINIKEAKVSGSKRS